MKRLQTRLLLILLATLPLQWQSLAHTQFGVIRWFHIPAMLFLASMLWAHWTPVVRSLALLIGIFVSYSALLMAFGWYHGGEPADAAQQLFYAATGLAVAVYARDGIETTLRWSAPAALVVFGVFFAGSAATAGLDPVGTVAESVANADPDRIEFGLFKKTFSAESEEARANTRHEIFAGLLVTGWISALAPSAASRRERVLFVGVFATIGGLALLSLSRSVILAGGLGILLIVLRGVFQMRLARRLTPLAWLGVGGAVLFVFSGALQVVWLQLTQESASYSSRISVLGATFDALGDPQRLMVGGPPLEESAHNFFLDAWLLGGMLAGALALLITAMMIAIWFRGALAFLSGRNFLLPAVAAAATAIVRIFTAGGGTLHIVEWIAFGFLVGTLLRYGEWKWRRLGWERTGRFEDRRLSAQSAASPRAVVGL